MRRWLKRLFHRCSFPETAEHREVFLCPKCHQFWYGRLEWFEDLVAMDTGSMVDAGSWEFSWVKVS